MANYKQNLYCFLFVLVLPLFSVAQTRPNIIYIYADDLGYGELGVYGQEKIKTPHLNQLAAEGIRFTRHYTSSPVCAPARSMLLTGLHAGHSPIRGNYELGGFSDQEERGQMPLPAGSFTIAHLLKQAGYSTAMIGKWGLGMSTNSGSPHLQGFDYYYGYLDQKQAHNYYPTHLWDNGKWDTLDNPVIDVHPQLSKDTAAIDIDAFIGNDYAIDRITQKALSFIKEKSASSFFLYLPYTLPHVALQVPDSALQAYKGVFPEQTYWGNKGYVPNRYPLATYAAMVSYLDKQVGHLLRVLKELNLDNSTLIFFSSDNGTTFDVGGVNADFFNLTAGLRGRKQELYEGGIRIPLIARWPGKIPPGKTTNHLSAQYDLFATIAELVGKKHVKTDGISFLPTLVDKRQQQKQHEFLYFEFPERSGQVAIIMDQWKAVRSNLKKDKNAPWELYNISIDPSEKVDRAAQNPALIKRAQALLMQEHQPALRPEWEFIITNKK